MWHRGFQLKTREVSQCVSLDECEIWNIMGRKKNRTDIRASLRRGVTVEMNQFQLEESYAVIANNLDNRYQKKPTHSMEELKDLLQRYPDRLHCWNASYEGEVIATTVVFVANAKALHCFYIAQVYQYANHCYPLPAIFISF